MPRRLSLSCRQFRHQHVEFVDGLLPEGTMRALRTHRDECACCSQHDVRIRRSLLVLQALPVIEPSHDFRARLSARLQRDAAELRPVRPRGVRWGIAGAIIAASAALLLAASSRSRPVMPIRLTPVLTRAPQRSAAGAETRAPQMATITAPPVFRFEALPGRTILRAVPSTPRGSMIRLQLASSPGQ